MPLSLVNFLLVGAGGFVGAMVRFGVTSLFGFQSAGILLVNVVGSFLGGLLLGLPFEAFPFNARLICVTGFLGAFTTFSAFSVETVLFFKAGDYLYGVVNIIANIVLCILGTFLGFFIASAFAK